MEKTEKVSESTKESQSVTKTPDASATTGFRNLKKSATWQRISISLGGIGVEIFIWQWATWHLYSLPPEAISSFTTITVNCFYVIGAMVVFFVTGKLVYDLKVDTVAQVITEGRHVFEKHEEKVDITERIIDERAPNENLRQYQE